MKTIIKIFFLSILFINQHPIANANGTHSNLTLLESYYSMLEFKVGINNLSNINEKYKCEIKEKFSEDQRVKFCRLFVHYKKSKPVIVEFISSAIGGWEVITEYSVTLTEDIKKQDATIILNKHDTQLESVLGKKKEFIIEKFGIPNKENESTISYEYQIQKKLSPSEVVQIEKASGIPPAHSIYDIYTGIEFVFSSKGKVMSYSVFKIETI